MLKKIKRIKGLGIFQDFTAKADLHDFSRFNLIYGWNGSGKTTLTRLLNCLETKSLVEGFPESEFELVSEESTTVKQNSLTNFKHRVVVFNQEFIEANIDWKKEKKAKPIVVISEEKIEERNRFLELRDKEIPTTQTLAEGKSKELKGLEKARDEFLTDLARSVKQSFQVIDTSDKHYFNYDRTKLKTFIDSNKDEIGKSSSILGDSELTELIKKVRPIQKPEILWKDLGLPEDKLKVGEGKIVEMLTTSVVSKSIRRLQEHVDINGWVKEGLNIHIKHNSKDCEFCGQQLPPERIAELENHFSKEYSDLVDKLNGAKLWITEIEWKIEVPEVIELYDELQESYKAAVSSLRQGEEEFRAYLKVLEEALDAKIGNPFKVAKLKGSEMDLRIKNVLNSRKTLQELISKHNAKTRNFSDEIKKHKYALELHFVASGIKDKKYYEQLDKIEKIKKEADEFSEKLVALTGERMKLEANLANVAKGADNFNKELHSFLGRTDISLIYDIKEKAYRIMRSNPSRPAENLSEGEKTAIAFVYFVTKINENGNKVEDAILVVDDPISSFDANHLFHSVAFLKRKCEGAKQLFVLTHNFQYFKMVRDWLVGKNKRDKPVKSTLFSIEVAKGQERNASITNAHETLLRFGSEYQYLFSKLLEYKDDPRLNIESAYQVANYSRKLLEGFFKFKHPRERNDFGQLMDAGCKTGNISPIVSDRVFKFINKYSHTDAMDFHDSPVDNLLSEGENITKDVLDIIRGCDETHFRELEEICNN